MTAPANTVFVVDDDASVRRSLARLLGASGYATETFASAREFLAAMATRGPGCLVLDLQMPELTGLELQEALAAAGRAIPIVFITGYGDIPSSVKAMKAGAVDFLPKPFAAAALLEAVGRALEREAAQRSAREEVAALELRALRLTPREREVFVEVAQGKPNKRIALDLGTTEKTVKVHRSRVMHKLEAESLADLVLIAQKLGLR